MEKEKLCILPNFLKMFIQLINDYKEIKTNFVFDPVFFIFHPILMFLHHFKAYNTTISELFEILKYLEQFPRYPKNKKIKKFLS